MARTSETKDKSNNNKDFVVGSLNKRERERNKCSVWTNRKQNNKGLLAQIKRNRQSQSDYLHNY